MINVPVDVLILSFTEIINGLIESVFGILGFKVGTNWCIFSLFFLLKCSQLNIIVAFEGRHCL